MPWPIPEHRAAEPPTPSEGASDADAPAIPDGLEERRHGFMDHWADHSLRHVRTVIDTHAIDADDNLHATLWTSVALEHTVHRRIGGNGLEEDFLEPCMFGGTLAHHPSFRQHRRLSRPHLCCSPPSPCAPL